MDHHGYLEQTKIRRKQKEKINGRRTRADRRKAQSKYNNVHSQYKLRDIGQEKRKFINELGKEAKISFQYYCDVTRQVKSLSFCYLFKKCGIKKYHQDVNDIYYNAVGF